MTTLVYRFALYSLKGNLIMSTEVDDPDPSIDLDFWKEFMGGSCLLQYLGEKEEI